MTAAQKERIAADFVVAFINKGRIKSNKESVKAFYRIHELLSAAQNSSLKASAPKTATTRKTSTARKKVSS